MSCKHTFAVCAHKESPYLEDCIKSPLSQTYGESEIYIATSTPNNTIRKIADAYNLPLYVNSGEHGIGQDWNFAYSKARGKYATIAHQDDIYRPGYAAAAVFYLEKSEKSILFFSNYGELRDGVMVDDTINLRVKRFLLRNLENGKNSSRIRVRRGARSLGCPICCPSVTINREICSDPPYCTALKCSLDWDAWETLSRLEGDFWYSTDVLIYHRIHQASATTELIEDNTRHTEDHEMLKRFWPAPLASCINHFYGLSEKSNDI